MLRFGLLTLLVGTSSAFVGIGGRRAPWSSSASTRLHETSSSSTLESLAHDLESALEPCKDEVTKTCKVAIGVSPEHRMGLVATENIKKGDTVLAMPYDDRIVLTPALARQVVFKGVLTEKYEGWTGDAGLVALLLLNELARCNDKGIDLPKRPPQMQQFMQAYLACLPTPDEMASLHPFLWSEEDQEVLQSSSTTKIYQALDDIDEDAAWLEERVWSKDTDKFPASVELNGQTLPCFTAQGYKWAMALVVSRCNFVDKSLRLLPLLDFCNHDEKGEEITGGTMGTFGTTKGAVLKATRDYATGEEIFCSYGPKSASDYLLEHGFCPPQVWKTCVSELTFELDEKDRFHDDKLDILEFETYDMAPMDPVQSFDVVSEVGRDGEPDPAMLQFVRLCKLGATDAFLLESIFRKEVWEFMSLPVSEPNELAVVNTIIEACEKALEDFQAAPEKGPEVCTKLRESETKALSRTMEFLQREKEALDLKEYYQERRLKDLGLDSEWSPEDDVSPDLGFGQTRAPGGADYDW